MLHCCSLHGYGWSARAAVWRASTHLIFDLQGVLALHEANRTADACAPFASREKEARPFDTVPSVPTLLRHGAQFVPACMPLPDLTSPWELINTTACRNSTTDLQLSLPVLVSRLRLLLHILYLFVRMRPLHPSITTTHRHQEQRPSTAYLLACCGPSWRNRLSACAFPASSTTWADTSIPHRRRSHIPSSRPKASPSKNRNRFRRSGIGLLSSERRL